MSAILSPRLLLRLPSKASSTICPSCTRRITSFLPSHKFKGPSSSFQLTLRRTYSQQQRQQQYQQPGDNPNFSSILDQPARLVRTNRRHRPLGLILLALIPLTAFALGTWQIQRLNWKTSLIARSEDRLSRPPLPLPPVLDVTALPDFDYRRVATRGRFLHDKEILLGPRLYDGENGYIVITPLDRSLDQASTILVNRGWISKGLADRRKRRKVGGERALPSGEVLVEGLLREPPKKNSFTPDNKPEEGKWYFPDVKEMAGWTGAQEVMVEETMDHTILAIMDRQSKGIPIGRVPEVNLRNNHFQYIVTWYSLGIATSIMFYLVIRRPPRDITKKVRLQKDWA
ncbi:surf-like protein [Orbilia oligospora]|uniref:SURF1-like protein n=1 Tax=Orbilia oligospora TaxID=2813651 RepID=A0A8H8VEW6_ORBOL|nr:surf-like protein [Orbilia oligospora]